MNPDQGATDRVRLEALIGADARALTAESDQMGRVFAAVHQVRPAIFAPCYTSWWPKARVHR
jgi:MarR family transcriptional regulator, organic hydroperoxide resistance regulator